jgi:hypothetical protein
VRGILICLIFALLACLARAEGNNKAANQKENPVSGEAMNVLATSTDPKQLVAVALKLARSQESDDQQSLQHWLSSPDFLLRLDSAQEYAQTGRRLRIQRVLQALAENPSPGAKSLLVALTQSQNFLDHRRRVEYLLRACAVLRPAPPPVVRFWDGYSKPDDGFGNLTMDAVVTNGSPPAMQLLEQKLADPSQPEEDRTHWILCYILEHRNDPGVLGSCRRMLAGTLPAQFRPLLIDALFSYRPAEWYAPAERCEPPDRLLAGPVARQLLRDIASATAAGGLTSVQKEAIEKTLREIGQP